MKTSKTFTLLLLAAAFAASSCKETEPEVVAPVEESPFVVRGIVGTDTTKVSYSVDNTANVITPTWDSEDVIIGFDNLGGKFTFTVKDLESGGREATFNTGSYTPAAGVTTLYAIYAPGKGVGDFVRTSASEPWRLPVDLSRQTGELYAGSPALMCATASVDILSNSVVFSFKNQTAVVGLKKFQLVKPGGAAAGNRTVSSITLDGAIASGTFEVVGGVIRFTPGNTPSTIVAENASGWAVGSDGVFDTPVYFVTVPTTDATLTLRASARGFNYRNTSAIPQATIESSKYYYMSKKLTQAKWYETATLPGVYDLTDNVGADFEEFHTFNEYEDQEARAQVPGQNAWSYRIQSLHRGMLSRMGLDAPLAENTPCNLTLYTIIGNQGEVTTAYSGSVVRRHDSASGLWWVESADGTRGFIIHE